MLLQNIQLEFADMILSEDGKSEYIYPVENRVVYRNNINSILFRTLQDIYPLICKLVGDAFFRCTAKEYIKQYPSRSGNLHDYGEYFSHFLAEYQPLKNLIYLAEVAQFEWICHTLAFAADHEGLRIELVESFPPNQYDQIQFTLHPASKLMKFHFPILRIIDLCKGTIDETINLNEGGANLLILRRDFNISLIALTLAEFAFLSALTNDEPLSKALEKANSLDAHFKLEEKLPNWISEHIIVDCCLP